MQRAPHIDGPRPLREGTVRSLERRKAPLLLANVVRRVRWIERQSNSFRQDVPGHRAGNLVVEHRQKRQCGRSTPAWRDWPSQIGESPAQQAVARRQMVIQKRQRSIGGERGEPEREASELNRGWIAVDTVEAPLSHLPSKGGFLGRRHLDALPVSISHESALALIGKEETRGDEKRAAAHRRIEDTQREDLFGRASLDERLKRAADEKLGDSARRIETAGGLALGGCRPQREGRRRLVGFVFEHLLVDRPQLFHTEVVVSDSRPALSAFHRGQCHDDAPGHRVGHTAPFHQRSVSRREQPPVERRHLEIAGAASAVRHPRDGLQCRPQSGRTRLFADAPAQRVDRVGLAVGLVPDRDESARLGKQQEQHAIDHRQRLLEDHRGVRVHSHRAEVLRSKSVGQLRKRGENPAPQRPTDASGVRGRALDDGCERRLVPPPIAQRCRGRQRGEDHGSARISQQRSELELDGETCPGTSAVDDAERVAVADQRPPGGVGEAKPVGLLPPMVDGRRPRHRDHEHPLIARRRHGADVAPLFRLHDRWRMAQQVDKWSQRHVENRARSRRGSECARHVTPPPIEPARQAGGVDGIWSVQDRREKLPIEKCVGQQLAGDAGDHDRSRLPQLTSVPANWTGFRPNAN